jgi:RNA polymerase sigma factor (sigma-70 family)
MKNDLQKAVDQLRHALDATGVTDAQLLSRFITERDEAAFAALVRRHGPMVLGVCRRILGNRHDTDDAFQATFLILVQRARSVANHQAIGAWLHTVACRSAQQAKVRNMRRQYRERQVDPLPDPQTPPAEPQDWQPVLDQELNHLPEKYRAVVILCDLQGRPRREAARQLNLAEGTLCSRLSRGRRMLATRLTRHGITLSGGALAVAVAEASACVPAALVARTTQSAVLVTAGQMTALSTPISAIISGVTRSMFLARLRAMLPVVMALLLGAGALAAWAGGQAGTSGQPKKGADGTITGRVVHADDGTPVGGADVRLFRRGTYSGTPPVRRTTANAQGEFTFDGVAPGDYGVWALHGNLASRSRMFETEKVTVGPDGAAKPVILKMRPGILVRVQVLGQKDGKPIAGARVRLIWTDTDRDHYTDADGRVELPALTAETMHIEASAKDHAAVTHILNLANEQPASLEMKLAAGGSVEGRITDQDGKPLAKVGINIYGGAQGSTPLEYVETDADGRYRFNHLNLGEALKLYAAKLDYLAQWTDFSVDPAKRAHHLDLVLKKRPHGGSVYGVVTDPQGKPVAGAEIFNPGGSSTEVRKAKTDGQGKYRLEDVYADGQGHQMVVRAKGLAPRRVEFRPGSADQPAEVNVRLEPGHKIKGIVLNETGKPVPGVWVFYAHGDNPHGMYFGGRAATDAKGRFQVDSLPADTPFSFRAEGYTQLSDQKLALDGDDEVVVVLKSQGMIKGRVVDAATGKPLKRFTVSITFSPDSQPGEPSGGLPASLGSPGEEFVPADGQFVLKGLIAGMPLQLTVAAPGYRRQVLRRVVAETAGAAAPVDLRLSPEDPAKLLTLRGKLVNHKGLPVVGADLRLIAATDRPMQRDHFPFNWTMIESGQIEQVASVVQVQRLTTGADGTFLFQKVPGDVELELVYWGKGIPPARLDHLEGLSEKERGNLEIKALAPARIVGTIDRKTFPEFNSIQLSSNSRFYYAKVAADGKSFTFEDLPPGTYEVQVYGPAVRQPNDPGAFQTPLIGRRSVTIDEGGEEKVEMGSGELVPMQMP